MKTLLLLTIFSILALAPSATMAQKKSNTKSTNKTTPVIKTETDSLSYVYGSAMAEGLPMYLTQLGVIADTLALTSDLTVKIAAETDANAKKGLENKLKLKLDSIQKANTKSMTEFLKGFKQGMVDKSNKGYNSGIAIASQIESMSNNFSKEVLGEGNQLNENAFINAFVTTLSKGKHMIEVENPQMFIQNKVQAKQQQKEIEEAEKLHAQYADKISDGRKFFATNKTKEGIVTLPNGLQYKAITMGAGQKPSATDVVKVHYKGTLLDGTPFDSSYDRGEPTSFSVGHVIKGWTEALQLMPVGSKWIVYIPYDLAYGSKDQGAIKPFSDLIFEVELLEIVNENDQTDIAAPVE